MTRNSRELDAAEIERLLHKLGNVLSEHGQRINIG